MCLAVMPKHGGEASETHRTGELNSTHSLLLCKGASQQLAITNIIFCLPNKRKILWMHSRSAPWQLTNNQHCLCADLRLSVNDCNWKHSKFLGTAQLRDSDSKYLLNSKMKTHPGGSLAMMLMAFSAKAFPIKSEMNLPG